MRRVGILHSIGVDFGTRFYAQVDAFKRALAGLGWAEGRNLHFEERWADNNADLPGHAMQLARLAPDVIFVVGSPALRAMRRASPDVPIVFASVAERSSRASSLAWRTPAATSPALPLPSSASPPSSLICSKS